MSNSAQPYPYFSIIAQAVAQLRQHGRWGSTLFAETRLQLSVGQGSSRRLSELLSVRLDTGAFVSLLPEDWMTRGPQARLAARSSERLSFQTAAGRGEGTLLSAAVETAFLTDPQRTGYHFDWLVTPNLNGRGYGLLALRDVVRHFFLRAEGRYELGPDEVPLELPSLELVPLQVWDRVRYHCPACGIVVSGRSGLHLICGDSNVPLVLG